jgi:hypothetical protein
VVSEDHLSAIALSGLTPVGRELVARFCANIFGKVLTLAGGRIRRHDRLRKQRAPMFRLPRSLPSR